MSSVGQVVGGAIGFFLGGPIGAQIGMTIGGLLDPPKLPTIEGPRLSDLSFQTSTYGAPLARIYGTVPIVGNIFWLENNAIKETVKKKKQGGKGGPSQTVKTYSYSATFAVALADTSKTGPIAGIRRIWIGSTLWYNAGSDDLETIIASNQNIDSGGGSGGLLGGIWGNVAAALGFGVGGDKCRVYLGSSSQEPDPRMQADIGAADCPAYRNTAYIVFYDLPLEKWGNSLQAAQVRVEVVTQNAAETMTLISSQLVDSSDLGTPGLNFPVNYITAEKCRVLATQWDATYPSTSSYKIFDFKTGGFSSPGSISVTGGTYAPQVGLSDLIDTVRPSVVPGDFVPQVTNARWRIRDGVTYWISTETAKLYVYDAVAASWNSVSISGIRSFDVDSSGVIWVLTSSSNIYQYDADLNLVASANLAFAGGLFHSSFGYEVISCHSTGASVIFFGGEPHSVFNIPSDLSGKTGPYEIDPAPGGAPPVVFPIRFAVDDGILIRVTVNTSYDLYVDRFKMPYGDPALIALADIVSDELQLSGNIDAGDIDAANLTANVRGYRIAGGSIRAALAPLQGAYPFDLIPSGYQIKAVPRGSASVATIGVGDLGAVAGSGMADVVLDGPSREMDTQLPREVVIKHLDPSRDYDVNEQRPPGRVATGSVDIETRDLPLVLTPDEAAGIAQTLLYLRWLERDDYAFSLPPTYGHLEPADVVTVTTDYASLPLRLTEISYGADGVLQCRAKPDAPAIYTPTATGGQGATADGTIPLAGSAILVLLDIPLIRAEDDEPGFIAAMGAETSGWPGGTAFRSNDNGQTFDDVQSWAAPGTFAEAIGALGADDGFVIDRTSTLSVNWICGTPESVTEDQILAGYNYFAYGADGRWEIMAVADIDMQSDGSYLCSTFLRGMFGTEWATGLHAAGDYLVLLDDPDNAFIGAAYDSFGAEKIWRAATVGTLVEDAEKQAFTYNGVNLKPLSPVNAAASRDGSNNLSATFNRRSRFTDSFWVTGVQPVVGESSESHEIDVIDGVTVVRTITATTGAFSYSAADQTADGLTPGNPITFRIYQLSATIGRGYPLEVTL